LQKEGNELTKQIDEQKQPNFVVLQNLWTELNALAAREGVKFAYLIRLNPDSSW